MLITQPTPSGRKDNVRQKHGEVKVHFWVIRSWELAIELVPEKNGALIFGVKWDIGWTTPRAHVIGG
jgi:hypothetical protein